MRLIPWWAPFALIMVLYVLIEGQLMGAWHVFPSRPTCRVTVETTR